MHLTPKRIFALIVGLGLPIALAAGWALGDTRPAGPPAGGDGAMGTAPPEEERSPAVRYDIYRETPIPARASGAPGASRTPSAAPVTSPAPAPDPTTATTGAPEEQTPSPEPTGSAPTGTPSPSAATSG